MVAQASTSVGLELGKLKLPYTGLDIVTDTVTFDLIFLFCG